MDSRAEIGSDIKGTNIAKSYQGLEFVESYAFPLSEESQNIKEDP